MVRTRGRLVVACLVVLGSAIAIAGGSAGNRDATAVLQATSSVSYGQDIVYVLSFKNDGNAVFTHVVFQMPAPTVDGTTLKASNPRTSTSACAVDTSGSLSCDFGQLRPEDPAIAFKVVWKTPGDTSQPGRADGLVANGTWLIKEGKSTNGNETFNVTEKASLLGTSTNANLSARQKAGGYQLSGCTAPNASSLATDQALDASNNPVATSFCLPSSFVASVGSGLQSAITEPPKTDQANYAHRSDVCVAQPGQDCDNPNYLSQSFSPDFLTITFTVSAAALPNKYVITGVSHDDGPPVAKGACDASGSFCVDRIDAPQNKNGFWTLVVRSKTNGHFNW